MAEYELIDYQLDNAKKCASLVERYGIAYLAAEVRTRKTGTVLHAATLLNKKNVLFVTKKNAITSIINDYDKYGFADKFKLTVINHESLKKIDKTEPFDLVIGDENHACFIGETMVDGKKIMDIRVGDILNSYNFTKNCIEKKKVIAKLENPLTENLVKIKAGNKEIICTESHEIYTKKGWKKARSITIDDEVFIM